MLSFFFTAVLSLGSRSHDIVKSAQPFDAAALTWSGNANVRIRVGGQWISPAIDDDIPERHATAITHFPLTSALEYEFSGAVADVTVTLFPLSRRERVQGERP